MRRAVRLSFVALLLLSACSAAPESESPPAPASAVAGVSVSEPIPGNPGCPEGLLSFKVDSPQGQSSPLGDGTLSASMTFEPTPEGEVLSWSADLGVDVVIVKGGNAALLYTYAPEASRGSGLHSPRNASGKYADVSHVTFCYDIEVQLGHVWQTSFERAHHWAISKTGWNSTRSAPLKTLELPPGQVATVNYDVTVGPSALPFTDSDWHVEGYFTVDNPAGVAAAVTGVSVALSDGLAASVACAFQGAPVSFSELSPYTLPSGDTLECRYSTALPDGGPRTATVTVATQGAVKGTTHTATVDFAAATVRSIDECVDVDDTFTGALAGGALPPLCAGDDLLRTFSYARVLGPYTESQCGRFNVDNVASFETTDDENDTDASGSASWTVTLQVSCPPPPPPSQGSGQPSITLDTASYRVWQADGEGVLDLTGGTFRIQNTSQATAAVQSILFSAEYKVGPEDFRVNGGATFACGVTQLPSIAPSRDTWVTFGCDNLIPLGATEVRLTAYVRIAHREQVYQLTKSMPVR